MKDQLAQLTKVLPFIIGFVYILGYIVIGASLGSYSFLLQNILDVNYLSAGISMGLFVVPVLVTVYYMYDNPTDDLSKVPTLTLLNVAKGILGIMLFSDMVTTMGVFNQDWKVAAFSGFMLLLFLINFLFTSYAARNIKPTTWMSIEIGVLAFYQVAAVVFLDANFMLKNMIFISGIMMFVALGIVGDKDHNIGHLVSLMFVLIFHGFMFGKYIYPDIPKWVGGGKSEEFVIRIDHRINTALPEGTLAITDTLVNCKVIFATDQYFLLEIKEQRCVIDRKDVIVLMDQK